MFQMLFGSSCSIKLLITWRDQLRTKMNVRFDNFRRFIYIDFPVADMIHEYTPITNAFVSVPTDMGNLNCASFLAGIIAGILDSSRFVRHLCFNQWPTLNSNCCLCLECTSHSTHSVWGRGGSNGLPCEI
jgi:hypothetical protein